MISSSVGRTLALPRAGLLALWCLLLLLPSLQNAYDVRAQRQTGPQAASSPAADRHQYQMLAGEQTLASSLPLLLGNQLDVGAGPGDVLDANDARLVADLMKSFGERQALAPLEMAKAQQQQHDHGTPGHYAFEVAPKMEPPSAPRPPFKQANSICPGSDPFSGFSARDTLCGDLYQGRVPLNPMGQSVNEQAYPFELIKNKTLQFLARSLPILKTEYETIPKVARYLPAHQLLNPTNLHSPLGHEHFHELNQNAINAPPFLHQQQRRRRKRQATAQHQASITVAEMLPNATLVVSSAHSAHSAGRIGHHLSRSADSHQPYAMITKDGPRLLGLTSGGSRASVPQAEPATGANQLSRSHASPQRATVSSSFAHGHPQATDHDRQDNRPQTVLARQQQVVDAASMPQAQQQNNATDVQRSLQTANPIGLTSNTNGQSNGVLALQQQHKQSATVAPSSRFSSRSTNSAENPIDSSAGTTMGQRKHATADDNRETSQLQARSSLATTGELTGESAPPAASRPRNGSTNGRQQQSANGAGVQAKSGGNSVSASGGTGGGAQPTQHLKCANVNGLFLYTVCQAASALVEGESTPSWLQAAKQIGALYSAASASDSYGSSAAQSNPIWSLWSAFAGGDSRSSDLASSSTSNGELAYKSSSGNKLTAGSSMASVVSLLNPLMSFFAPSLQRTSESASTSAASSSKQNKSSSGSLTPHNHQSFSSNLKTISNLLLTGLSLAGLYDWLGSSGSLFSPTYTTFAKRKKPFDPSETFVDTPASLAAMASAKQLSPGAASGGGGSGSASSSSIGKQPPTPCPSVEEYISPTFARNYQGAWKYVVQIPHEGYFTQTIQRSSCTRQKCEFTEGVCHEAPRWVSLLVAEIYYPHAIFGLNDQQNAPNTLSSSTSNQLNQRVSLGAPFDAAQNGALLEQLMATSPSISNLQQVPFLVQQQQQQQPLAAHTHQAKSINSHDPLQMTDSLSTYNHNLNSLNAATELGLDLTNVEEMQKLANMHNYQLMQRNGLVPSHQYHHQQQPQIESRVSHAAPMASGNNNNNNNNQASQRQQQQQQYKVASYQQQQQVDQLRNMQQQQFVGQPQVEQTQQSLNNDYIKALAIEMLRQNPHLSVDDLIKSLQLQQQVRKKRDLSTGVSPQAGRQMGANGGVSPQQARPMHHQHQQHIQPRSSGPNQQPMSTLEGLPSVNNLGAGSLTATTAPQQQLNQQQQQQATIANNQPMASASQPQMQPDASFQVPPNQDHRLKDPAFQEQLSGVQQQNALTNAATANQANLAQATNGEAPVECDGHDKIGCYVVRVYYDWFLVNGSCKCWKTNIGSQQQSASSSSNSAGNGSGSLIRRIFTG